MHQLSRTVIFLFLILISSIRSTIGQEISTIGHNAKFKSYISIPMGGNSWAITKEKDTADIITGSGVIGWSNPLTEINTYFKTGVAGKIHLAVRARAKSGRSELKFRLGNETKKLTISNSNYDTLSVGTFILKSNGYKKLTISGIMKESEYFAEITDLLIFGETPDKQLTYVKDEFYWGRRGPSVHLNYKLKEDMGDIEWFYNEVTVPAGNDVEGSFFMANGFGEGYFGIQVNGPAERRILFSVWSPFKTDNPSQIPEDQKIILIKKGTDVHAGNFGDEGSGGQSYKVYDWKSGVNYRFLVRAKPSGTNSTDYSAYFYAPETEHWELIAQFRRPKTTTWLKHLHSFLENFIPENGNITRLASYSNQWVCNASGDWFPLHEAQFSADATARKGARVDYSGGNLNNGFYLKNCGFFNDQTQIGKLFTKTMLDKKPDINFSLLP